MRLDEHVFAEVSPLGYEKSFEPQSVVRQFPVSQIPVPQLYT